MCRRHAICTQTVPRGSCALQGVFDVGYYNMYIFMLVYVLFFMYDNSKFIASHTDEEEGGARVQLKDYFETNECSFELLALIVTRQTKCLLYLYGMHYYLGHNHRRF